MRTTTAIARGVLLFASLVACNSPQDSSDAGAVTCGTTEPLSACAQGWQFDGLETQCPCTSTNKQPECAKADCQVLTAVGYLDGGIEIEGTIFYSAQAGTMSTWLPAARGQWNLADGYVRDVQ